MLLIANADDWVFMQEGMFNIVLQYRGHDDQLVNHVLRLRKYPHGECPSDEQVRQLLESEKHFAENIMGKHLGHEFVFAGEVVCLGDGFVGTMMKRVDCMRTPARQKASTVPHSCKVAWLQPDLSHLQVKECRGPQLCIEIKPKWAIVPSIDCISQKNEVKTRYCRFCMHQSLKQSKSSVGERSRYCPLMLFSEKDESMVAALHDLIQTPQNNFRCYMQGTDILPQGIDHLEQTLKEMFDSKSNSNNNNNIHLLCELIVAILQRSQVLDKIKLLQQLDRYDIETIYNMHRTLQGEDAGGWSHPIGYEQYEAAIDEFLLATSGKDCSILMTIQQGLAAEGDDCIHWHQGSYVYRVAVIDIDPRDKTRIPSYYHLDQEIVEFFKKHNDDGGLCKGMKISIR